ncbi:MAG: ankyrin repeat domain-containing protein, partial [Pirellulaceae bacterium]|nr:ankyrin repeat domain-containing protein [Pirellulaceae bacterium]
DVTDWTPLMYAAGYNKNHEVISVLLKAGADVKAKNNEGSTALDFIKLNEGINHEHRTQAVKELEAATNP